MPLFVQPIALALLAFCERIVVAVIIYMFLFHIQFVFTFLPTGVTTDFRPYQHWNFIIYPQWKPKGKVCVYASYYDLQIHTNKRLQQWPKQQLLLRNSRKTFVDWDMLQRHWVRLLHTANAPIPPPPPPTHTHTPHPPPTHTTQPPPTTTTTHGMKKEQK